MLRKLSNSVLPGHRLASRAALNFYTSPLAPGCETLLSSIGGMPWVSRPPVDADVTAIAALLLSLLHAPVTRSAQGLKVAVPKCPFGAPMWYDMIGISRGDNLP